ncbi:Uncharacterized protein TCM_038120 [Theobroma cacao]|uniref:Uncharacterized protein n=1 Tax=Theobroma cacao TaxID=3641 RepID=A0A061GNM2_THECC|nr:Uncharacterized protein TCM_038120 [Theobroma cacao]
MVAYVVRASSCVSAAAALGRQSKLPNNPKLVENYAENKLLPSKTSRTSRQGHGQRMPSDVWTSSSFLEFSL